MLCEDLLAELAELQLSTRHSVSGGLAQALQAAPQGTRLIVISPRPADDPSFENSQTDLPMEPDELVWIDVSRENLSELFTLD